MSNFWSKTGELISSTEWAKLFADKSYQIIKQTKLDNGIFISTVWLGISYGETPSGPLIFETIVWPSDKSEDEEMYRYTSERDALFNHNKLVESKDSNKTNYKTIDLTRWKNIVSDNE